MGGTALGSADEQAPALVRVRLELPEYGPCGGLDSTVPAAGAAARPAVRTADDSAATPAADPAVAPAIGPRVAQLPAAQGAEGAGVPAIPPAPPVLGVLRTRLVFLGLVLALLLAALEQTIVATALPRIVGELHGLDRMSWAVTAYLLAATIGLPVYGKLGDLFGRKGVFLFAIALFVAGSALAGWSRTMTELIAYRAVQGAGAAGLMTGVQAITADLVPPRRRGRYMGLTGAAYGFASVAGPLLGGWLTDRFSWRWCFYLNVPFGLVTLALVAFVLTLPRRDGPRPRLDVPGALLLTAFSTCLVLLTSWGGIEYAWDDRVVLALAAGAVLSGGLFLLAERRAEEPLLPLRLFRDSVFNVTGVIGAVTGVAVFGAASYLPGYLQMVYGASATESGLLMLPMLGGIVVGSTVSGRLISRTGRYRSHPLLGCALAAVGMWLLSGLGEDTGRETYGLWTGLVGLGVGLAMPVLVLAVQNAVRPADLGTATSASNYFRQMGGSVGAAVFGTLFAHRLGEALARNLPRGTDGLPGRAARATGQLAGARGEKSSGHELDPTSLDPTSITPGLVHALPAPLREGYVRAYADAIPRIFLYLVPVLVLGLLFAFFLKERPLVSQNPSVPDARNGGAPEADARIDVRVDARGDARPTPPPLPVRPVKSPGAQVRSVPSASPPEEAGGPGEVGEVGESGDPRGPGGGVPVCGSVRHHDGSGVPYAALTLIDTGGRQVGRGAAGEDGRYALSTPSAGSYVLIAAAGGHQPQAVSVAVSDRPVELDVVLGGAGRLAGRVLTAEGQPVRDAAVTLTDAGGEVVAAARSGLEGEYALGELVAGDYTLTAGAPACRPAALPVSVQAARETRQDVELAGGAVLRGTVRAESGRPVEDARVTLLDGAGNVVETMRTGSDGSFRFVDLSSGEYTVIAAGYPPVATVLRVAGGGRTERDVQLGHDDRESGSTGV